MAGRLSGSCCRPGTTRPTHRVATWLASFHERGFAALASRFMRALCHHYGVELHNFAPNAISQAATFVGVCKGYLGIPVN
jgi:predicted hydrolase (HD superfamily)